jgi:hypothetical protein
MPPRSTILVLLAGLVSCLAVGVTVGTLAQDVFPDYGGPIILVGILVPGLLLGVLAGRFLIGKDQRVQYTARLRKSEPLLCLICGFSVLGMWLSSFGGVVAIIGFVITVSGLCVLGWMMLRAIPPRGGNDLGRDI